MIRQRSSKYSVLVQEDEENKRPEQIDFNNQSEVILQMLLSETSKKYFERYSISEFSLENMIAFLDLYEIQKQPSLNHLRDFCTKYVNKGSEFELNLSARLSVSCKETLTESREEQVPQIMDRLKSELLTNLMDTFDRFKFTREYRVAIKSLKNTVELKNQVHKLVGQ
ncbi:hypothetical protein AKO1_012752 [Acrasis kona]|uniref:RGS domain-containing protein n=1 Tax=Acrasis kona TaxID=1008807 RepID=A0AAW2YYD9_9EUKA